MIFCKNQLLVAFVSLALSSSYSTAQQPLVVQAKKVITATGQTIENGTVVCVDGKIKAIGKTGEVSIPEKAAIMQSEVAMPGMIDVRSCAGLSGILNVDHDSDHLESSSPLQPELRAIDAYNPREELVEYIRSFGVTTIHTGHAPGELMSGQTLIAKTIGNSIEEALIVEGRAIAATLAEASSKSGKSSPGTRGKQMAMLRTLFIEAQELQAKIDAKANPKPAEKSDADGSKQSDKDIDKEKKPEPVARNLRLEAVMQVLAGKKALLITADRAQDIASAIRLAEEFKIKIWLDSAADAHLMIPQIKAAGICVLLHPSMARASGEKENQSFLTASKLQAAQIPFAIQGGFEAYVPKVRVVLFEAAIAASHGLSHDAAIESITISPARILGIQNRVGSLEVGKDADLALYDGDPLEYTTHCVGVIINGKVVSTTKR
ncbi:MAG: amidohydrolase family protein [Planctomycetota bacterium]|nr:amidohydrolase family protein [Planctomycetota bacterium]